MKFQTKITSFDSNPLLYEYHLPIPDDIYSQMIILAPDKRVKCIYEETYIHYSCMSPKKGDYHFILLNKEIMKKMNWKKNDIVNVDILTQDLKYGIPICEELEEVLSSEAEGSEYFHAMTIGKQRTLIHVINKYKNPQLRIERSIILLRHLIMRKGDLDFKILQINFRDGL